MKKVIGKARFSLEGLKIISTEEEATINSSPLTYIDDFPNNKYVNVSTLYTEEVFIKNVINMNLKILQKMMQDLIQNVQLKLYINSSSNLRTSILLAYKRDIFIIKQDSKTNVEHVSVISF